MFKKLLLASILTTTLLANDTPNKEETSFLDDLINEVSTTLDSDKISDKVKLENMQEYITNLKFDDKVDKSKYKLNLMGHYENYMLLGSYTNTKLHERHWANGVEDTYNNDGTYNNGYERDTNEAQFQLSIKTPLYNNFLGTGADLFTAYTQNSYWQVYDTDHSSPFRETNYMPELFLEWQPDKKLGDSHLKQVRFALIHQSNGQDVGQSRSWNRTEMFFLLQNDNINYGMHIWDRWDEDRKNVNDPNYPNVTEGDDNPELEEYLGNQRYFVKYKSKNLNLMLTHQNDIFEYDIKKGNTKLDITFPSINSNFDFFIRYFNGYGESLVDYDVKLERISFGIQLSDWI
ncbi:MAG: phospholipase A [Campylobacterota bacterium]|nr:phospholipase A [Campylobacterota bacterium]